MGSKSKPKLGQNFLVDDRARHAIVDALGPQPGTVIEIGPGHGAITSILAGRCRRLIAVELDEPLVRELRFTFREQPQVEILHADILQWDPSLALAAGETADVVGNLPYYITSDILLKLFRDKGLVRRAVLMMQREVAERIAAAPGIKDYGVLSVTAQMHAEVELLFTLPPDAFSPAPEVDSSVVRLEFRSRFAELGVDAAGFDRFVKQCFAQKRKTLMNNLRAAGFDAEELRAQWVGDIPEGARAEQIRVEHLAQLYRSVVGDEG